VPLLACPKEGETRQIESNHCQDPVHITQSPETSSSTVTHACRGARQQWIKALAKCGLREYGESRDFREETLFTSRREEGNEDYAHSTQHARTDKALNLCKNVNRATEAGKAN